MTADWNRGTLPYASDPLPSSRGTISLALAGIAAALYFALVTAVHVFGKPTGNSNMKAVVVGGVLTVVGCAVFSLGFAIASLRRPGRRHGRAVAGIGIAVAVVVTLCLTT